MATQFDAMLDVVDVKNRVVDGPVRMTFDGKEYLWEAGEVKRMPRSHAEWFRAKSLFRMNPGDMNEGIPASSEYKLAILGEGHEETNLTRDYVNNVRELLDADHMPELTRVDPATGKPMRRVYIDPRPTGAMAAADAQKRIEDTVRGKVTSAMVSEGAEAIAEVVAKMPEEEFAEVVRELPQAPQEAQAGSSRRVSRA